METLGSSLAATPTTTPMQDKLMQAQIANLQASSANLLSEATSRSRIANARLATQSLNTGGSDVGAWSVMPRKAGAAQKAQDDFGDVWEQLFGTANIGSIKGDPTKMGPMSREFWRWWLGQDFQIHNQ